MRRPIRGDSLFEEDAVVLCSRHDYSQPISGSDSCLKRCGREVVGAVVFQRVERIRSSSGCVMADNYTGLGNTVVVVVVVVVLHNVSHRLLMPPFDFEQCMSLYCKGCFFLPSPCQSPPRLGHLGLASIERIRPLLRPLLAPWESAERTRFLICPSRGTGTLRTQTAEARKSWGACGTLLPKCGLSTSPVCADHFFYSLQSSDFQLLV
jgi:hypothetical protein